MAVAQEGKGLLGRTEKATAAAVVLMRCATSSIGSGDTVWGGLGGVVLV